MRYLKKFNEELKSSTYKSAASKLQFRHPVRSKNLTDFGTIRLKEEELEEERLRIEAEKNKKVKEYNEWQNNIKKYSPFGKFTFNIKPDNSEEFNQDFYLMVNHWYDDGIEEINNTDTWLNLDFFLIPLDTEGYERMDKLDWDWKNGGYFHIWRGWIKINLREYDCTVESFTTDTADNFHGKIEIADRKTALKFKRLMTGIFTNKEYPDYENPDYNYEKHASLYNSFESTLAKSGISSDYGLEMSNIADCVNKITVNSLYKTN